MDLYDRFVAYLTAFAVGAEHAQTAVTICAALALEPNENSRRQLRACAEQASHCGVLVCSGQRGYYLPALPEEVFTCTVPMKAQAGEMWDRAKRMEELAVTRWPLPEPEDEPDPEPARPPMFAMLEAEA